MLRHIANKETLAFLKCSKSIIKEQPETSIWSTSCCLLSQQDRNSITVVWLRTQGSPSSAPIPGVRCQHSLFSSPWWLPRQVPDSQEMGSLWLILLTGGFSTDMLLSGVCPWSCLPVHLIEAVHWKRRAEKTCSSLGPPWSVVSWGGSVCQGAAWEGNISRPRLPPKYSLWEKQIRDK